MPTLGSDDPSDPNAPTISAQGHIVTGVGFLPDHAVAIRITCAGEDVSDYLAYTTDRNGHLRAELPTGATGAMLITATDHRPDPDDACGRLWSNTVNLSMG